MSDETDPQAAIDAERDRLDGDRDDRIHEYGAGDDQPGIPFVGAGPGDPRLLTVAGRELLDGADLVVHAGSLVNSELLEEGIDPETPVAVVYHASWPDEDVIEGTVATVGEAVEAAGYRASAMVLIGGAARGASEEGYERSYLYDGWANRGGDTADAEGDD